VLYPLLLAQEESHLTLVGGTHNIFAPPYDFLAQAFLPIINRMGPQIVATIERYGFVPRGGGQLTIQIKPASRLNGMSLTKRGNLITRQAKALITGIPEHVAHRELEHVAKKLKWPEHCLHFCPLSSDQGPGNVLLLEIHSEHVTEVFTAFAQRGVRAEIVADEAIKMAQAYLASVVPVSEYLADQLLLPLALAGEGEFTTLKPSQHTLTNIEVIKKFLPISMTTTPLKKDVWLIDVSASNFAF